ncbi:chromosome segregation protein SMC [Tepidimonas sp.]|uniref:chromosome segregation protein SMC n=1 Tax=Tepidimonas sp. TaxID=2002775 RepID=UPI002FE31A26
MRLQTIKLSGFKSFADPTTFDLPGQLVGVVGPNGCGKSNIMDAVRWVLGESRASELRGESMQDVIFNGSAQRKPAQRASVELVFDNSARRAGGPWNQYAEIAVRRVLTRDGTSSYTINNQPVRRRDVQDLFLGTGLGPRAYAIIGQGTISRIIESRPEELRLFLEEAAGVSKYKERRRETAARLADTRDNLTRVEDILRELHAQLQRLEQQAEVARRYHELQERLKRRQHQLWWLKREEAAAQLEAVRVQGLQALATLEERVAALRALEADLETLRQSHYAAGEAVNAAQGQVYQAAAEAARLQAQRRFATESRQRAQQRLQALQQQLEEWAERAAQAAQALAELDVLEASAAEEAEVAAARVEEQLQRLPVLEDAAQQVQQQWTALRERLTQVQQALGVQAAEQRALDEQLGQLRQREQRLSAERGRVEAPDPQRLQHWRQELEFTEGALAQAQARLHDAEEALPQAQAAWREAQQAEREEARRGADIRARLQALQALQERLANDERLQPWLREQGLEGLASLWPQLDPEPGWEAAIETALRERVRARCVRQLDGLAGLQRTAPPVKLTFLAPPAAAPAADGATLALPDPAATPLLQRLRVHDVVLHAVLADWLQGCLTAPDLTTALRWRSALRTGQRLYTPQGHSVGRYDLTFHADDDPQSGMLARAHEIEDLQRQARAHELLHDDARQRAQRAEALVGELTQRIGQVRRELGELQQRRHALQLELLAGEQRAQEARRHEERLAHDLHELQSQIEALQERRVQSELAFEALDLQLADLQEQARLAEERAMRAAAECDAVREQWRAAERQAQEARFTRRTLATQRAEWQRQTDTAAQQRARLQTELEQVQQELAQLHDDGTDEALQQALQQRQRCDAQLAAARSRYDELTARLRAADEQRLRLERELEPLRARITDFQLKEQAAQLALDQLAQQLAEAGAEPHEVQRSVTQEGVRLSALPGEIDRLQRDIAALGAVNLAALQELEAAREREQFLSHQSRDLQQAIQTLENAIRTIDAETRQLLAHTFDTVNVHFGQLFPELFGGGQARLIMTGDEILDAGVQVMAQPPGKRNQTIHLLSGGEKALTAIALVFAMFQLNPAPFCLLDEVDAPLDDANTERYARLVTRMSRDTQFLFISHNRIAMEMAQQLIGVTMQEQGVSRIVAVDLAQATSLMENAAS